MSAMEDTATREQIFQDNFEKVYLANYSGMIRFARRYVIIKEEAENIVQDTFAEIWEGKKGLLYDRKHFLALLFITVKNK
jgi:RNA polymerase sigma-70 factor (ECF subfamily)